ncbi:MAG: VanZ family protein [Bryobacteraceae bacterium]|jgi:VanZ family protein
MNRWILVLIAWVGVIFFSSTSLASQWCEQGFHFLSALMFNHLRPEDSSYGLIHLLADKGVHVSLFFVLAVLLWKILPNAEWKVGCILLLGAGVGSASEFLQSFFPGRDPAVRDVLINIAGTAVGVGASVVWIERRSRAEALVLK